MKSSITINIVEPASPTPIDPGTSTVVPDTGLFTSGIGGAEAAIIATITLVVILAIVGAIIYYKKKQGKASSLLAKYKQLFRHKKSAAIGLTSLAIVVSLGTVASLVKLGASAEEADNTEVQDSTALTVTAESEELTIELADEPVFAVLPVELTVAEATEAGYTLTAYAEDTDLVSATDSSSIIPMVTVEGDELSALADNTYGLALVEPQSQEDEAYTSLSTDSTIPTFITDKDYKATEANDTTTIYYGFYITPDVPYGTYTGTDIIYKATENAATVVYNGNGLYFNDDESQTTNTVKYIQGITDNTEKYSHTANINNDGVVNGSVPFGSINEIITIPGAATLRINLTYGGGLKYNYLHGFASFWQGSFPNYTADSDYAKGIQNCGGGSITDGRYYSDNGTKYTVECSITGDTVTFGYSTYSGPSSPDYGYYAIITGYDADGNIIHLPGNNPVSGDYLIPSSSAPHEFFGWSESENATQPTYYTQNDIEMSLTLNPGTSTTLYAVRQYMTIISFDGNGNTSGEMQNQVISAGQTIQLPSNNFSKTDYYFTGWNTEVDGSGISYSDNANFTAGDSGEHLTLYAQWKRFCSAKSICYRPNGANAGDGDPTMSNQTVTTVSGTTSAYLWPTNYKYDINNDGYNDYGFVGWSEDEDAISKILDNTPSNYPVIYGPNEYYTSSADFSARGLNLYAVWMPTAKDSAGVELTFQTENLLTTTLADGTTLASKPNGYVTALKDSRDNQVYAIAKLADGNYWMMENLRLSNGPELTSQNTNNPATGFALSASSDEWCKALDVGSPDKDAINAACINQSYLNADNITDTISIMTSADANIYSYGNYYNWYSATAGNGKYETNNGNAAGDICPKGWHLPYGGNGTNEKGGNTSGGFFYLSNSIDGTWNSWFSLPNNFVMSGYWTPYSSSIYQRSGDSYYWSSTPSSSNSVKTFRGASYPGTYSNDKHVGLPVRCVLTTLSTNSE